MRTISTMGRVYRNFSRWTLGSLQFVYRVSRRVHTSAPPPRQGGTTMHGTRTTRNVLDDHLARRGAGDLEGDLATNYDPDVMILHAGGALRGHDGVRDLDRQLSRYRATNTFQCHRLLTNGE